MGRLPFVGRVNIITATTIKGHLLYKLIDVINGTISGHIILLITSARYLCFHFNVYRKAYKEFVFILGSYFIPACDSRIQYLLQLLVVLHAMLAYNTCCSCLKSCMRCSQKILAAAA